MLLRTLALLTMGVMAGAVVSHLTFLGVDVRGDGGLLFGLALWQFGPPADEGVADPMTPAPATPPFGPPAPGRERGPGGRGTRLAPITDHLPKPMVPVAGRPILERLVLHLVGMPKRPEISVKDFCEALQLEPTLEIPFDPQLFGTAANNGQMIAELSASHRTAAFHPRFHHLLVFHFQCITRWVEHEDQLEFRQSLGGEVPVLCRVLVLFAN